MLMEKSYLIFYIYISWIYLSIVRCCFARWYVYAHTCINRIHTLIRITTVVYKHVWEWMAWRQMSTLAEVKMVPPVRTFFAKLMPLCNIKGVQSPKFCCHMLFFVWNLKYLTTKVLQIKFLLLQNILAKLLCYCHSLPF